MPPPDGDRSRSLPLGALLSLAGICLLLSAWLHDDAYISFRVIDNWRDGHGLRWNVVERVQAYTHPLWLLTTALLTPLTGSPPAAAILLSLAASLATLWLIVRWLASSPRWHRWRSWYFSAPRPFSTSRSPAWRIR